MSPSTRLTFAEPHGCVELIQRKFLGQCWWVVQLIQVDKEYRSQGIGTRLMKEITKWADANSNTLLLHVVPDGGIPIDRLTDFYRRFGFTNNKGGGMIRMPTTKHTFSYQDVSNMVANLVARRLPSPNLIVGLARGGLIPAVILSHHFDCKMISLSFSLRDHKVDDDVDFVARLPGDVENQTIWIVDDIVDSGATLKHVTEVFATLYPNTTVVPVVLTHKKHVSQDEMFYVVAQIEPFDNDTWIEFPWELPV